MMKTAPRSVTGKLVLDMLHAGKRFSYIERVLGVERSYVAYVNHKYATRYTPAESVAGLVPSSAGKTKGVSNA